MDDFGCRVAAVDFLPGTTGGDGREFGTDRAGAEGGDFDATGGQFGAEGGREGQHIGFGGGVDGEVAQGGKGGQTGDIDEVAASVHVAQTGPGQVGQASAIKVDHVELPVFFGGGKGAVGAESGVVDQDAQAGFGGIEAVCQIGQGGGIGQVGFDDDGAGSGGATPTQFGGQALEAIAAAGDQPDFIQFKMVGDLQCELTAHAGRGTGDNGNLWYHDGMDSITESGYPCQRQALDPTFLFAELMAAQGQQGWWPLIGRAGEPGFDAGGYHPELPDYVPESRDRFEILVGAILTQNTAWHNVALVLAELNRRAMLDPSRLAGLAQDELAALIRPTGYFNQKAKKLLIATRHGVERGWWADGETGTLPGRDELLGLWGIGPETADSILLYAWGLPSFVVDAYTRRWLSRLSAGTGLPFNPATAGYETIRHWFMAGLEADASADRVALYQEFHALVVIHAKRYCQARPDCQDCPLAG